MSRCGTTSTQNGRRVQTPRRSLSSKSEFMNVVVALVVALPLAAADIRPTARVAAAAAVPEATAMKLDGEFSEAIWEQAPVITDFRQRDPEDGAAPSFPTEVRIAYDASNMYVAVQAMDPDPSKLVGLRMRRDSESPSDWIRVIIDSFHDRRTAFEFGVNPAGVKLDRYWFDDGNFDQGWDAVWEFAVSR